MTDILHYKCIASLDQSKNISYTVYSIKFYGYIFMFTYVLYVCRRSSPYPMAELYSGCIFNITLTHIDVKMNPYYNHAQYVIPQKLVSTIKIHMYVQYICIKAIG